jgi:hypothetical protein
LHAEFQGDLLPEKCQRYIEKLRTQGDPAADDFICEGKFWFHANSPKLWSVAIYYIVVTLATCVPPLCVLCKKLIRFGHGFVEKAFKNAKGLSDVFSERFDPGGQLCCKATDFLSPSESVSRHTAAIDDMLPWPPPHTLCSSTAI